MPLTEGAKRRITNAIRRGQESGLPPLDPKSIIRIMATIEPVPVAVADKQSIMDNPEEAIQFVAGLQGMY